MKPLAVDLFCGRGGWTNGLLQAGFHVVGVDLLPQPDYPRGGEFLQADVRSLDGAQFRGAAVIVASPPCQGFSEASRLTQEGVRPNAEDFELLAHALRVIRQAGPTFWAIENVRGAWTWWQPIMGDPAMRQRPWYLWGKYPGFVAQRERSPKGTHNPNNPWRHKSKRQRAALVAEVPAALSVPFARACMEALA